MTWPHSVPLDLRRRIDGVLGQRTYGAAEIWGEVRDWLEAHQVKAPECLPFDQPVPSAAGESSSK